MKRDNINNSVLIIIGIAAVVMVSQLFAGTFNNFHRFSKSISTEYNLLKAQKSDNKGEESFSMAQKTSSPDLFGYEKPLEPTTSPIHEDDNTTSLALTKKEQPNETFRKNSEALQLGDIKVLASDALRKNKPGRSSSDVQSAGMESVEGEAERERIAESNSPIVESDATVLLSSTLNMIDNPVDSRFQENYSENTYLSDPYTFEEPEDTDLVERDNEESNDRNEEPEEYYDISVWRNISSGGIDQGDVDVDLSIHVDSSPPNGLILTEYIPKGWDLLESSPPYRTFNASSGEVKWMFIGNEVGSARISYKIFRKESTASTTFHGTYMYNGPEGKHISLQIDGANGV